jgi:Predicted Zn peptidase
MLDTKSLARCHPYVEVERITFVREARGLTKKALSEIVEKSTGWLTQIENGTIGLTIEMFEKFVEALDVRPEALTSLAPSFPKVDMGSVHFRANKRVPQMDRIRARCYAQQVKTIYDYVEAQGIRFPQLCVTPYEGPQLSEQDMGEFASRVRSSFGLGLGPILNMANLLEGKGVRIILLPDQCAGLDAFSTWISGVPCVMIAGNLPASRMQFDYGHELAHLLLDHETPSGDLLAERRAHRFAAAFLMPQETFAPECPTRYYRDAFIRLKTTWHVSIGAALYRSRELDILTDRQYRYAIIRQNQIKERINEPGEFERPVPTILSQALELLSNDITLAEMSDALALKLPQLTNILTEQGVSTATLRRMSSAKANIIQFRS